MMKRTLLAILAFTTVFAAFSCAPFLDPSREGEGGSLRISFGDPARNLFQYYPAAPASFRAHGDGPGEESFDVVWNAAATDTCTVENLVTGAWSVQVWAYEAADAAGSPYRYGVAPATVTAANLATATVLLGVVAGTGSISWDIAFSADLAPLSASVDLYKAAVFQRTESLSVDAASAAGISTGLMAGEDWSAVIHLAGAAEERLLEATIHVTDSRTTAVVIDASAYGAPAPAPTGLAAVSGRFLVELSWTDVAGESGYLVERRAAGEAGFATVASLGPDTVAYVDKTAEGGTTWEYRVASIATGSALSSPSDIASVDADYSAFIVRNRVATISRMTLKVEDDGSVTRYGATPYENVVNRYRADDYLVFANGIQLSGLSDIVAVHAGESLAAFIDAYGKVWTWDAFSSTDPYAPSGVPNRNSYIERVVDLDLGSYGSYSASLGGFVVALDADGAVWTWGLNVDGQLGDGTTTSKKFPKQVPLPRPAVSVAAGVKHTLVALDDGSVYAWGDNYYYQLGLNDQVDRTTPTLVPTLSGIVKVAAGYDTSYAIDGSGQLYSWGYNNVRQLFHPDMTTRQEPTLVAGLPAVAEIRAMTRQALALTETGTVLGAGMNNRGILLSVSPNGVSPTAPLELPGLSNIVELYAGGYDLASSTESLRAFAFDGSAWYAWGDGRLGERADGSLSASLAAATWTPAAAFTRLVAGSRHAVALDSNGEVWTWGYNDDGQLGLGDKVTRGAPGKVALPSAAVAIASASAMSYLSLERSAAVLADGSLYLWGNGATTPFYVNDGSAISGLPTAAIAQVALGATFTIALDSSGQVWAWGTNVDGQLGDGTTVSRTVSAALVQGVGGVGTLTGVRAIAAGGNHALALLSDGSVVAWGDNAYGQIGDGTTTDRSTPVVLGALADIAYVTACFAGSGAIASDGTLYSWGDDSIELNESSPAEIAAGGSWVSAEMDFGSFSAVTSDGRLVLAGKGVMGNRGDGKHLGPDSYLPLAVPASVTRAAAGEEFSLALAADGTVYAWGSNEFGQLGIGSIAPTYSNVLTTPIGW